LGYYYLVFIIGDDIYARHARTVPSLATNWDRGVYVLGIWLASTVTLIRRPLAAHIFLYGEKREAEGRERRQRDRGIGASG